MTFMLQPSRPPTSGTNARMKKIYFVRKTDISAEGTHPATVKHLNLASADKILQGLFAFIDAMISLLTFNLHDIFQP